jgi:hypothetical protein
MQAVFTHLDFFLNVQETFSLQRAARTAVTVKRGTVWVTQDGRREDHVLRAGQTLRIDGDEMVIVSALGPAEVALDEGRRRGPVERVWRRLAAAYLRGFRRTDARRRQALARGRYHQLAY